MASRRSFVSLSQSEVNYKNTADIIAAYIDKGNHDDFPVDDILIYPDFITENEETSIVRVLDRKFKRVPYADAHFDQVIRGYRELSISQPEGTLLEVCQRVKSLFPVNLVWNPVHILDLNSTGAIGSHVDNVQYSGQFVVGVCLLSSAVMTFKHDVMGNSASVYLPHGCLYVMKNKVRYEYAHEICAHDGHYTFKHNIKVPQKRRITVMLRDAVVKS